MALKMDYTYQGTDVKIKDAYWKIIGYNCSRQNIDKTYWYQVGILPYPTKELADIDKGQLPNYFQLPSIVVTLDEMKENDLPTILYEKLKLTDFFKDAVNI